MPGGGGGTRLSFGRGGGAAGGRKPDPVTNHSARKTYTLSQYTLLKLSYAYPVLVRTDSLFCCVSSYIHTNLLRPARAVAGARSRGSRACHKHCGPARTVAQWARESGKLLESKKFDVKIPDFLQLNRKIIHWTTCF